MVPSVFGRGGAPWNLQIGGDVFIDSFNFLSFIFHANEIIHDNLMISNLIAHVNSHDNG